MYAAANENYGWFIQSDCSLIKQDNCKAMVQIMLKNDFSEYLSNPCAHFDIVDLNNDSIPELLVSTGQAHVDSVEIYTISKHRIAESAVNMAFSAVC